MEEERGENSGERWGRRGEAGWIGVGGEGGGREGRKEAEGGEWGPQNNFDVKKVVISKTFYSNLITYKEIWN